MPVPTHGPSCRTLFCRQSMCLYCNQAVYHWSCSCGSSVLFDKLGEPWPQHLCFKAGRKINVKPVSTYTYGVSSVMCTRCGKSVRKKDVRAHEYFTHGIGKRPDDTARRGKGAAPRDESLASSSSRRKSKVLATKRTATRARPSRCCRGGGWWSGRSRGWDRTGG